LTKNKSEKRKTKAKNKSEKSQEKKKCGQDDCGYFFLEAKKILKKFF